MPDMYDFHQEADHQSRIKYLFHQMPYLPTHKNNQHYGKPARLANILPKLPQILNEMNMT